MAGRMHGGLIAASGNANTVEHEHEHKQRNAVPETVGGHGWDAVDRHRMPPFAAVVNKAARQFRDRHQRVAG